MKKLLSVALGLALLTLVTSFDVGAVDGPHVDPSKVVNTSCTNCHNSSLPSDSITFNSNCLSCHNDFYTGTNSAAKLTSHKWIGSIANPAVGAQPPATGALSQVQDYTGSQLACVNCHNPHSNGNTKYQRIPNDTDQLCLDCHRSRNVQTAAAGSHPVLVGYSSAAKAAPDKFAGKTPVNANPANPTSDLGAKLSHDGKLLCSTCHGVHSADSRSSNYVNGFKNISTGDGNLLRTNPRGGKVASGTTDKVNICTNCHAGKMNHNGKGQDVQCIDCHGAHVEYDPNDPSNTKGTNVNLIRRNLPGTSNQIYFRYTGDNREYKTPAGTGVCQGCHVVPSSIAQHASNDPKVCNTCHKHDDAKGSFTAGMADHTATPGSGDILMFTSDSTHDVTPLSIQEECTLCHYADLVVQHGNNCAVCHSGANPPRNSINGAWNKTCQQGSCHPTIHSNMQPNHFGKYWNSSASCDLCHDTSGGYPGPGDNCSRCHSPHAVNPAVPPPAPTGILTFAGNALTVIDWTTGAGTKSSLIRYGTASGTYTSTIEPATSPTTITGLTNGTTVYFQIGAKNAYGTTWSAEHSVTPVQPLPSAPYNISAAAGNAQATISWTAGSGSTSSLIRYGTTSGNLATTIDPAVSPRTITGLTNGTPIYYQVGAKNGAGTTWNTTIYNVTPQQPLPSAPTGITASAGNGQATISWTAGAGSTSSLIRYGTTSGNLATTIDPAVSPRAITGLTNGTPIYYQVGAKNSAGTTWNTTIYSVTPQQPLPSAPIGITASAGNGQATISWTAGAGSTSSLIRYGTTSANLSTTIDPAVSPRTITGLANGTPIYYQVGAKNSAGTTWNTTIYSVTPQQPLPSAPTGITASAGNAQATISWTAGAGSTSSLIRYGTTSANLSTTIDPAVSPRTITGLTNGTPIYYQVGAKNSAGTTWDTTIYNVTPSAAGSGGGTATLIGHNYSSATHPYTHFWVNDVTDTNLIADGDWSSDEHETGATFVVPAGVGYVMHVEWEIPEYEGYATGSDVRVVSPSETSPGAIVTWELQI